MGLENVKLPTDCNGMSREEYFECRNKAINDVRIYKREILWELMKN